MSEPPENPRAFPIHAYALDAHRWNDGQEGMTLRDFFAAKAMQAAMTAPGANLFTSDEIGCDEISEYAYHIADAMLERRSK